METRFPQCILVSCLLPWRQNLRLDEGVFRQHIKRAIANGFEHLYLMGTAGEGYGVTDRQFEQAVKIFQEEVSQTGLKGMVGVISLSTPQILERIDLAYRLGIRQFQVSLPGWKVPSDREMMEFFQVVCGNFPEAVFLHYNLPRTKRLLTGLEYRRVADQIPNLVATKNSTTDQARIVDLMIHAPDLQHFFIEDTFALGCLFGECSLLGTYAFLFPEFIHRLFKLGRSRDIEELMQAHQYVQEIRGGLLQGVTEKFMDGAYDKLYVWLRDPTFPLRLLPPYQSFSAKQAQRIRAIFQEHFSHHS